MHKVMYRTIIQCGLRKRNGVYFLGRQKEIKTNAMRILDRLGITYEHYTYECTEFVDGIQIADQLGLAHEKVYKTLVTVSDQNRNTGGGTGAYHCQRRQAGLPN